MTEARARILDASVAVKWHLHDEDFVDRALKVLEDYQSGRIGLLAPDHIRYEVPNAFRVAVRRSRLSFARASEAVREFFNWQIPTVNDEWLIHRSWEMTGELNCGFYDGLYLALSEFSKQPLIHADQRLHNTLAGRFPLEIWIEDY